VKLIEIDDVIGLADYEHYAHLAPAVSALREDARRILARNGGLRLWMVNSTATGGGVAEMLPKQIAILRELGVDARWAVIETDEPGFFSVTKQLHNMIHGAGSAELSAEGREVYLAVNRENADALAQVVGPDDVVVIHDPQPAAAGMMLREKIGCRTVWRCHIGLDSSNEQTRAAWEFLEPFVTTYDRTVFSAAEYAPSFARGHAVIIQPAIDPLSHKNRELTPHKLTGILCNAALAREHAPVLTPPFPHLARRLAGDGRWTRADGPDEIGLLFRPIITQVSRWDRLKGWGPLLDGFVRLKKGQHDLDATALLRRQLQIVRLVLAGPDPSGVTDDPEGAEVLEELSAKYAALDPSMRRDVAIIALPMESRKENSLMVNALQRCSSIVVQNSVQEGFGLTVSEALWKRTAVVGSRACGIRLQIRDGIEGRLIPDAEDPREIARVLREALADPAQRIAWSSAGARRVYDEFLVFTNLRRWLHLLGDLCG
jgi:trehalose synthase